MTFALSSLLLGFPPARAAEDRLFRSLGTVLGRLDVSAEGTLPRLSEWIYAHSFVGWPKGELPAAGAADPTFIDHLSASASGATVWEDGFALQSKASGGAFLTREGVRLYVAACPSPRGGRFGVRAPCARPWRMPGYFVFLSRGGRCPQGPHLRVYTSVTARGAGGLVRALARDSGFARARFEAKFLGDPALYLRRDSGVFYAAPKDARALLSALRRVSGAHPGWFRDQALPFTRRVGRGLFACEADGGSKSYGEHCCALVAAAALEALREGRVEPAHLRERTALAFAREGLALGGGLVRPASNASASRAGHAPPATDWATPRSQSPGRRSGANAP